MKKDEGTRLKRERWNKRKKNRKIQRESMERMKEKVERWKEEKRKFGKHTEFKKRKKETMEG